MRRQHGCYDPMSGGLGGSSSLTLRDSWLYPRSKSIRLMAIPSQADCSISCMIWRHARVFRNTGYLRYRVFNSLFIVTARFQSIPSYCLYTSKTLFDTSSACHARLRRFELLPISVRLRRIFAASYNQVFRPIVKFAAEVGL